jgi:hypothetical protein
MRARRGRWALVLLILSGCGGSSAESRAPGSAAGAAQARLQGTWEIVRYVSKEPIPPEAMPLMGAMFEDLRLQVKEDAVVVEGKSSSFRAVDEDGDTFKLKTDGMFDNASCKFNSPDEFEVDDQGPTWPGKSVLHRLRH